MIDEPERTRVAIGALGFTRLGRLGPTAVQALVDPVRLDQDTLAKILDPVTGRLAASHHPVGVRRVELQPGSAADLVARPSLADPRAGRVYDLVVATTNATGHSGQIRFRQRGFSRLRTVPHPEHVRGLPERRLRSLPLNEGECALFDDGVVWSTFPNFGSGPTSFAVVTLAPIGASLVLHRSVGGALERHEMDAGELQRFLCVGKLPSDGWSAVDRIGWQRRLVASGRLGVDDVVGRLRRLAADVLGRGRR